MIRQRKKERGITLVSLVITVIIMAILTAVVVNITINQNIVDSTKKVAQNYEEATVFQTLNTMLISERSVYENGFIDEETMWNNIEKSIIDNEDLKQYAQSGNVSIEKTGEIGSNYQFIVTVGVYQYKMTMQKVEKVEK